MSSSQKTQKKDTSEQKDKRSAAQKTPVSQFRHILFLPMPLSFQAIQKDGELNPEDKIKKIVEALRKDEEWEESATPIKHIPSEEILGEADQKKTQRPIKERTREYEEYIYFHQYIQKFLFGRKGSTNDLSLFHRKDITHIHIELEDQGLFQFEVNRISLYLWPMGMAFLCIEISSHQEDTYTKNNLTLAIVEKIQDEFRRIHIPFFWGTTPGRIPLCVNLINKNSKNDAECTQQGYEAALKYFEKSDEDANCNKTPALLPHISHILPDCFLKKPSDTLTSLHSDWLQPSDERMPTMSYISIENPCKVTEGDMIRLCQSDSFGGDAFPYSEPYLTTGNGFNKEEHFYDRYWDSDQCDSNYDDERQQRLMFMGYHFVALGTSKKSKPKEDGSQDVSFFHTNLVHHFRRHYFLMGLICHFQHAMLEGYRNWIIEAEAQNAVETEAFGHAIHEIQKEILGFTHAIWFTSISGQLQAGEMYDLWRNQLKTEKLFAEVQQEAENSYDFLAREEEKRIAQATIKQADAANQLAMFAGVAVILGLPMAFLGMNIIVSSDGQGWWSWRDWATYFFLTFITATFGYSLVKWPVWTQKFFAWREGKSQKENPEPNPLEKALKFIMICAGVLTAIAGAIHYFNPPPPSTKQAVSGKGKTAIKALSAAQQSKTLIPDQSIAKSKENSQTKSIPMPANNSPALPAKKPSPTEQGGK